MEATGARAPGAWRVGIYRAVDVAGPDIAGAWDETIKEADKG